MAPFDDARDGALAPVVRAARRHWYLVLACIVLAGVAAGLYATSRAVVYKATAQVLVTPLDGTSSYGGLPVLTNSVDPTRTLQTAASILESSSVADRVVVEIRSRTAAIPPRATGGTSEPLLTGSRLLSLELPAAPTAPMLLPISPTLAGITAEDVIDDVSVDPLGDSDIVSVVARRSEETAARQLANAYARNALAVRSRTLRAAVRRSVSDLRARQAAADASSPSAVELARELTDLQRILDGQDPNFSLLKVAGPVERTGASPVVLAVLGALGGALLGLLGAMALDQVNRRVRDEQELLDVYELPVLARIPAMSRSAQFASQSGDVPSAVREAMRVLQFQLEDGRASHRAVMLTSPSSGDGKTTTALNLAYTAAASGGDVIVLDLDLRKSELGARLGLQVEMMDLAGTDLRLEDHLRGVPGVPGLRVLSCRVDQSVAPLFESVMRRVATIIGDARQLADIVIVDTPPLGAVADALRVAGSVDEVVLVVRPGHTDRKHLQRTREMLDRLGHTPTGLVLVAQGRSGEERYGYGVQTASREGDPPAAAASSSPPGAGPRR